MKRSNLVRRAVSAALAGCMMFTLSAPALAESTDALMQLSIGGKSAVSVLDSENSTGDIKINNKVIDPADYDNIVINNKYTFRYDSVRKVLTSTNMEMINAITIEVPDDVDVVLDGKEHIAVNNLTIKGAHDVTISSEMVAAIGSKAEITCTGKVTINAPGGTYAIGYTSRADGTLIIHGANEVEIDASGSSRVLSGYGKADITCDGPVTIHGKKDGGSVLANADNFTYHRPNGGAYIYFTSEDTEEGAIDASVTPIKADARYSYLCIEEKQDAHLKVNNGTATAGDTSSGELDSFKGQKVAVASTVEENDERKFDGWEVVKAPADFTIDAAKLAEKEFSFIMPAGEVELTAHYSNKLEVSGGTAKVNGNTVDFARPEADVTVTATDLSPDYKFDHWEVSGGDIHKTEEELKTNPLNFIMPDAAVKLNAVYRAAVNVSNGTAQTGTESGETVYALKGDTVTVTGHDSSASFSKFVGWKLEKGSITEITDADGNSQTVTVDEKGYLLDADGAKLSAETFSFTMPDAPVTLKAIYGIPPAGMKLPVIVEGGTINGTQDSVVLVKSGEKVTIKADAPAENMQFHHWKVEEGTSEDFIETVGVSVLGSETEQGNEEISFIMPGGAVKLTAQWSGTPATKPQPDDEDHQLDKADEDFGVDPIDTSSGDSGAGGAIAAVAIGGAAVLGGYEITTRVILHNLLPEGAAIPANRGQLALLVWNNAGRPEPVNAPAFTDVSDADMAKAAQWCVEQGVMDAKSADTFAPDGWTPKFKVIEVWNKAFPKQ